MSVIAEFSPADVASALSASPVAFVTGDDGAEVAEPDAVVGDAVGGAADTDSGGTNATDASGYSADSEADAGLDADDLRWVIDEAKAARRQAAGPQQQLHVHAEDASEHHELAEREEQDEEEEEESEEKLGTRKRNKRFIFSSDDDVSDVSEVPSEDDSEVIATNPFLPHLGTQGSMHRSQDEEAT